MAVDRCVSVGVLHDWRLLDREPLYVGGNVRVGWRLFWYCTRCRVFDVTEWKRT